MTAHIFVVLYSKKRNKLVETIEPCKYLHVAERFPIGLTTKADS